MQVQARQFHSHGVQSFHGAIQRPCFKGKPKPSSICTRRSLAGTDSLQIKIHTEPDPDICQTGFFQPVQFPFRVQIHNMAPPQGIQKGVSAFDRAIINDMFKSHIPGKIVFIFRNDFRVKPGAAHMHQYPGKRIGFKRIPHNRAAPVIFQRLLQKFDPFIQLLLMDDITGRCDLCLFHVPYLCLSLSSHRYPSTESVSTATSSSFNTTITVFHRIFKSMRNVRCSTYSTSFARR